MGTSDYIGKAFSLVDSIAYAEGAVVSKVLLDKKEAGSLTLFSFDIGQGLTEHTSPYDAIIEILDGECEVSIAGETQLVKTGEMLIMPANQPHALLGKARFKMLLTMIRKPA